MEPTSSLVWADVILADFQRVISRYLQDISTYLSCTTQRVLRTISMQKAKLKYACLPSKIVEVWIDRFCLRYDWWGRLQPTSSVSLVWFLLVQHQAFSWTNRELLSITSLGTNKNRLIFEPKYLHRKCISKFDLKNVHLFVQTMSVLTHWGRVTHICVDNLTIIGWDNGLSSGRHQAIMWTSAGILLIGPVGINFSEILIRVQTFSFKIMHLKMLSAKWLPFCPGFNVLDKFVSNSSDNFS